VRRFIRDFALFCGLLLLLLSSVDLAFRLRLRSLRLDPQIATVIVGDSHTQTGLDDSIVPHAVNISHSEEHLLFSYQKLALLLSRNPGIRTVVLGLSFHTFSANYDSLILRSHRTRETYPTYFPMLDYEGRRFLLLSDPVGVVRSVGAIVGREIGELALARRYADYSFWGHFYRSARNNLNEKTVAASIRGQYYEPSGGLQGFAVYQVLYLKRIVRLCADHAVTLVLVNVPISPQYAARVPQKFIDNYYATVASIVGRGVVFLDYHDLALPADWFGDAHHINAAGAAFLSRKVVADIAKAQR